MRGQSSTYSNYGNLCFLSIVEPFTPLFRSARKGCGENPGISEWWDNAKPGRVVNPTGKQTGRAGQII
jgi:hypothetical protein